MSDAMRPRGLALYGLLVRLYPPSFRARYGVAMTQLARDVLRERDRRARWHAWRFLLADLGRSLPREHAVAFADWRARRTRARQTTSIDALNRGDVMGTLSQDLRYAVRTLRRSPGFALVVILSLALGIGANTLIFSVVDGLVLHPFPYPHADRLIAIGVTMPKAGGETSFIETLSPAEYLDITSGAPSLERVTVFDLGNRNLSGGDRPERVFTAFLWGDPFATIGLKPLLGRGFRDEETRQPGPRLAILSHRIWQTRFGGDSTLIGRAIQVNGEPTTVVGIMPPALLLFGTDLWLPMAIDPGAIPRRARQYSLMARVRDGSTLARANAELHTVASRTATQYGREFDEYAGWRLEATPWAAAILRPLRPAAFAVQGAVAFVLLICCANIASLMLARAAARQREMAVRRALGAAGGRIARQLLTESLLLAGTGAVVGSVLARALIGPVVALFPAQVTSFGLDVGLSGRVLVMTLGVSLLAGLLFGLAPAVQLARSRGTGWLTGVGTRLTMGKSARRLRQAFTVVQLALALVLLAGAGLLVRSFARLQRVDAGMDVSHVLTMRLSLPREKYAMERVAPFFEDLSNRLEAVPGVVHAAAGTQFPPANGFTARLGLDGDNATAGTAETRVVDVTNITERFLATLGAPLTRGRALGAQDTDRSPRVAVINETLARRFFPAQNPVGKRIRLGTGEGAVWREVVGVVGDVHNRGLDVPTSPEVFVPLRQQDVAGNNQLFLLIRTRSDPTLMLQAVRAAIAGVDADQPVYAIQTLQAAFADSMSQRRAALVLITAFAVVALMLAAVGIYGILSYLVSERTHEFGIRMALGAAGRDVVSLVVRQTAMLVGAGTVLGLAGALALGRSLSSLVFEIRPHDPATLAAVALLLAAVGLGACLAPARRATRVPPVEALRVE